MNFAEIKKLFAKTYLESIKQAFTGAYNMSLKCLEKLPEDGVYQIFSYGRPCYPEIWIDELPSKPGSARVVFTEYGEKRKNIAFNVDHSWTSFSANGFEIYQIVLNLLEDEVVFKISPFVDIHFMDEVFGDNLVSVDAKNGIAIKTDFFEHK